MPRAPRQALGAALLAVWLVVCLCPEVGATPAAEQSRRVQPVRLRVLDSHDRPVTGAVIELRGLAGEPAGTEQVKTDALGVASFGWRPQVVDETVGTHSADRLITFHTELEYLIRAPGFVPSRGRLASRAQEVQVANPALASLNQKARLLPLAEVVVLHRREEFLAGELSVRPAGDPLVKRLMEFQAWLQPVGAMLGVAAALPCFSLERGRLTVDFRFRRPMWGGLAQLPLKGRLLSAALPVALALGQKLLPLPGVKRLRLRLLAEQRPKNDPHALPVLKALVLQGAAKDFLLLGRGKLAPESFLMSHPPALVRPRRSGR